MFSFHWSNISHRTPWAERLILLPSPTKIRVGVGYIVKGSSVLNPHLKSSILVFLDDFHLQTLPGHAKSVLCQHSYFQCEIILKHNSETAALLLIQKVLGASLLPHTPDTSSSSSFVLLFPSPKTKPKQSFPFHHCSCQNPCMSLPGLP